MPVLWPKPGPLGLHPPPQFSSSAPAVSIIIPVVNNLKYNRECLESIFKHSQTDIHQEIIVVDNHSTDGSREYFKNLGPKIRLIANNEIKTFSQSCNQGAQEAKSDTLLFLNNDTYVTDGWLRPMLGCLQNDPEIGLVANKQLFPKNGLISHAGGAFSARGQPEHIYLFFDPDLPFLNKNREMQWVTACCIAISKKLFTDVGGFDESYKNSFEDLDLCFKIRSCGLKSFYCSESVIYHYGQATAGRETHEDENRDLFFERWSEKVKFDLSDIALEDIGDKLEEVFRPDHHLERLLYERYLLMGHVKELEKTNDYLRNYIEMAEKTLSWRITFPIRLAKKISKKLTKWKP